MTLDHRAAIMYKKNENMALLHQNAMRLAGVTRTVKKPSNRRNPSLRRGSLPTITDSNAHPTLSIDIHTKTTFRPVKKDSTKRHDIATSTAHIELVDSNPNDTDPSKYLVSPCAKREKEPANPLFQGVLTIKKHKKKDSSDKAIRQAPSAGVGGLAAGGVVAQEGT